MKSTLFTIAIALGAAAGAQETPAPAPVSATTGGGQIVPAGNTSPARDARGIIVISDPAETPAGFNEGPRTAGTGLPPDARPAPRPATENYPVCSRTVTDNCVQGHERGRGPR